MDRMAGDWRRREVLKPGCLGCLQSPASNARGPSLGKLFLCAVTPLGDRSFLASVYSSNREKSRGVRSSRASWAASAAVQLLMEAPGLDFVFGYVLDSVAVSQVLDEGRPGGWFRVRVRLGWRYGRLGLPGRVGLVHLPLESGKPPPGSRDVGTVRGPLLLIPR